MATIFSAQAGRLVAVIGNSVPFQLSFTDWEGYFTFKAIVTQVGFNGMGGHQFSNSLLDMIYLYVFNEQVGNMAINGLAAANICESDDNISGLENVQNYYESHRITSRATPLTVTIGATFSVRAFLVGINHQISDASTQVDQFSLIFKWLPRKTVQLDGCQDAAGNQGGPGVALNNPGFPGGIRGVNPSNGGSFKEPPLLTPINTPSGGSLLNGLPSNNPKPPLTLDDSGSAFNTPSIKQTPGVT